MEQKKKNPNGGSGGKPEIGSSRPFQDLASMVVAFPELPDFQDGELDIESLKKQAVVIREKAEDVGKWTAGALAFLDSIETLDREEKELAAVPINKAKEGLERLLHQEATPAFRRAAWLACLKYMLSREFRSAEEVKALFRKLVESGYLQETPDGLLNLDRAHYAVPPEAAFGDPEIQEIAELMGGLADKVRQAEKTARRQKAEELVSEGDLTINDFLDGKKGKLPIQIPAEKVNQVGNGVFWRSGGLLLVESDGEKCWPVDALGGQSFEGGIEEARGLKVYLIISSLIQHDRPPFPQGLPEPNVRKLQLLWHLLRRGIRAHEEKERIKTARKEMSAKATIAPAEFFLKQDSGLCLVEYRENWHTPDDETVADVFFLVERVREEGLTIRVVEVPDHLHDFLGDCVDQEFPEKDEFRRIPYPLGAVLKAVYGQTQKTVQIASKQD